MQHLQTVRRKLSLLAWRDWCILILLVIAAFLRFWKLEESAVFLGDQGRDALIVSRIFREGDLVSIGPTTSVGNMYLGPLYYYFMVPFLYLSYPSPLGPAFAVAGIGTITVFFLYYWGRKLIGTQAALFAAFLATFSATAVNLSRFSWNPNPAPFVTLLMIYANYLAITKHPRYWVLVGFCFAILLQLHYITLLAGGAAGVIWLYQVFISFKNGESKKVRSLFLSAAGAIIILLLSLLPLVLFDAKHGWLNANSLSTLLSSSENFEQAQSPATSLIDIIRETHGRAMHILFEFLIGKELLLNRVINSVLVAVVAIAVAVYFLRKTDAYRTGVSITLVYLLVGILGLSTYKHTVFDHYIAFLLPSSFLLLGFVISRIYASNMLGKIAVAGFIVLVLSFNLPRYAFRPAGASFTALQQTAQSIHARVGENQRYGIALLTGTKDYHGMNYRYYLSLDEAKEPIDVSEQNSADLLFIIDEEKKEENPEFIDIFEISSFPSKQILEKYEIENGPSIVILKRDQQKPSTNLEK